MGEVEAKMLKKFFSWLIVATGFVAALITILEQFDFQSALIRTTEDLNNMHSASPVNHALTLPGIIGLMGGVFALCGTAIGTFLHRLIGQDEGTFWGQFIHYLVYISFFVGGIVFLLIGVRASDDILSPPSEILWPIIRWAFVAGVVGAFTGPACDKVFYGEYGGSKSGMPSLVQSIKWFATMGGVFGVLIATGYVTSYSFPPNLWLGIRTVLITTSLTLLNGVLTGILAYGLGGIGARDFERYRGEVWSMFAGALLGAAISFLVTLFNEDYRSVAWMLSAFAMGPYLGALTGLLLHVLLRDRIRRVILGPDAQEKTAGAYVYGMKLALYPVLIVPWGTLAAVGIYLAC